MTKITSLFGLVIGLGLIASCTQEIDQPAASELGSVEQALSSAGIEPIYVQGNPTCQQLDLTAYSFKVDGGPFNGIFTSPDGYLEVELTSPDGIFFQWSSNVGVDAVIAKGGPEAFVYVYDPEGLGDGNLSPPINPSTGIPYEISHIDFCFDYEVIVTKTAETSFTRAFEWEIAKSVDQQELLLSVGQQIEVGYTVEVDLVGFQDSDFAVHGEITIFNPAPMAAMVEEVADVVDGEIQLPVDCGIELPIRLLGGQTLTCTYQGELPDSTDRLNVATAITSGEVGGGSGQAAIDFSQAEIFALNECVTVVDSMVGELGTVCASDPLPAVFEYSAFIGPYTAEQSCEEILIDNLASLMGHQLVEDSPGEVYLVEVELGQALAQIKVAVACQTGCTLTPGYWKTHSAYGPAPYDETWALVGEDTLFFDSGKSWYETLWTAPQGGNAFYILAHAYQAAYLNELNGADTSAVADTLATAALLLDLYDGSPRPMTLIRGAVRAQFLSAATILDDYNNGLIGPGHCSE
ncbi:MAG: hypothetical protein JW797_13555 [Bradymonadales bacterium]|nr:hypothetical protein [Bradymonadales bacterium]